MSVTIKELVRNEVHASGPMGIGEVVRYVKEQYTGPEAAEPVNLECAIEQAINSLICEKQIEVWVGGDEGSQGYHLYLNIWQQD